MLSTKRPPRTAKNFTMDEAAELIWRLSDDDRHELADAFWTAYQPTNLTNPRLSDAWGFLRIDARKAIREGWCEELRERRAEDGLRGDP